MALALPMVLPILDDENIVAAKLDYNNWFRAEFRAEKLNSPKPPVTQNTWFANIWTFGDHLYAHN